MPPAQRRQPTKRRCSGVPPPSKEAISPAAQAVQVTAAPLPATPPPRSPTVALPSAPAAPMLRRAPPRPDSSEKRPLGHAAQRSAPLAVVCRPAAQSRQAACAARGW
jgi:hypothetical protein